MVTRRGCVNWCRTRRLTPRGRSLVLGFQEKVTWVTEGGVVAVVVVVVERRGCVD